MDPTNGNSNNGGDANANPPAPNTNDNASNQNTGGGADGQQNGGTDNQNGGGAQLTDEQLQAAFQHPRFKELTQAAQELKTLKDQQAQNEAKQLEEQGKFKELAEQHKVEAEQAKQALKTMQINNAVMIEAAKLGAHDPQVVAKLIDGDKIKLNDDGAVEGVDEAIKALQSTNSYLFKTGASKNVGGGDTNPAGGGNTEFAASQYQDAAYYAEHQKDMDKAMAEGRVDMTR